MTPSLLCALPWHVLSTLLVVLACSANAMEPAGAGGRLTSAFHTSRSPRHTKHPVENPGQSSSSGLQGAAQFAPTHYLDLLTSGDSSNSNDAYTYRREDSMGWTDIPYEYRQDHPPDGHSSTSHDQVYVHPSSWDEACLPPPPSPNVFEAMQQETYGLQQQQQQQVHSEAQPQLHHQSRHGRHQNVDIYGGQHPVQYFDIPDSDDSGEEANTTAAPEGEGWMGEEEFPGPVDIGREHDHEITWPTRWTRDQKSVIYTVVRDILAEGKEYKNVHNMYSQMRKKVNNGQAMTLYYGSDEAKGEIASMFRRYKVQRPDWYIHARPEEIQELLATHRSIFHLGPEATRTWFYRCTSVANARRMLQRARVIQEDLHRQQAQQKAEARADAARSRWGRHTEE